MCNAFVMSATPRMAQTPAPKRGSCETCLGVACLMIGHGSRLVRLLLWLSPAECARLRLRVHKHKRSTTANSLAVSVKKMNVPPDCSEANRNQRKKRRRVHCSRAFARLLHQRQAWPHKSRAFEEFWKIFATSQLKSPERKDAPDRESQPPIRRGWGSGGGGEAPPACVVKSFQGSSSSSPLPQQRWRAASLIKQQRFGLFCHST